MPSIEGLGYPLVFEANTECHAPVHDQADRIGVRAEVRALEGMQAAQRLVSMGEQTCFLHAAMRSSSRTRIRAEVNGESMAIDLT